MKVTKIKKPILNSLFDNLVEKQIKTTLSDGSTILVTYRYWFEDGKLKTEYLIDKGGYEEKITDPDKFQKRMAEILK